MAVDKVRHVGDLVACVAAENEAFFTLEALRKIKVEYEILKPTHDMKKSLEDVDEPIHDEISYWKK